MRSLLIFGWFVLPLAACGGSANPPLAATPNQSAPTVVTLIIVGPATVTQGSTEVYSATAMLSNGIGIANATPTMWSSDNASVVIIDANGILSARLPGTATITATYQGITATARVQVRMNDRREPARLVISYVPDPVPASLTPCTGAFKQTPSWMMDQIISETQGVGFRVKAETLNLYNETALYQSWRFPEDYYFEPNSQFVEDGCSTLGGAPSGFLEDIIEGVDDLGNWLTFASRVRLLPMAGAPSAVTEMLIVPKSVRPLVRSRHRVR